jgi:predicted metalloprotease with PDZ domain
MATPARAVRSAVDMSEQAPFADAGVANDMNDRDRTFFSYYTQGAAIALALDLSLRQRSAGRVSLDDYMRLLWQTYGAVPDPRPGYVGRPYTLKDLREALAQVGGDPVFANEFFDRYVEGRDVPDFGKLLGSVGYVVRQTAPNRGWIGSVRVRELTDGLLIGIDRTGQRSTVAFQTPLYEAGLDEGDVVTSIDGRRATLVDWDAIAARKSGERLTLVVRRRDGREISTSVTVQADPRVSIEAVTTPTADQLAFRDAWLGSRVR